MGTISKDSAVDVISGKYPKDHNESNHYKELQEAWAKISRAARAAGWFEDWFLDDRELPWDDYIAQRIHFSIR